MIKQILYKWFKIEPPPCESCETLKMQLAIANHEKEQMLSTILSFNKPVESAPTTVIDYEKLRPKMTTWNVRRQMLEAEDRKAAQLLAESKKRSINEQINELENEVGIGEAKDA